MALRVRVCDVALDPRSSGSDSVWTYRADAQTQVGDGLVVPLGTRSLIGYVTAVYEATEAELGFAFKALRSPVAKVEGLSLPPTLVDLAKQVAFDTLCSLSVALSPATPPGVRDRLVSKWSLAEGKTALHAAGLNAVQAEVFRVLLEEGTLSESKGKRLPPASVRALKTLRTKGLVEHSLRVVGSGERRKAEATYRLCAESDRIDGFLKREGKRKPAQALTLMRLRSAEVGTLTGPEIRALAGVTEATVRSLVTSGLLEPVKDEGGAPLRRPPTPNPAQALAVESVVDAVQGRRPQPFLLYGVTGSGKTEVYLRAAAEALRMGCQVLYLVPEITLAAQAIAQLRERFGNTVAVMHSSLPETERLANWVRIRDGQASVILGARSALFSPLCNLGLIIIDEEHEQAYKQESAPRYHAKRVALALAKLHRCPLLLGSATPSIESFSEADEGNRGDGGLTEDSDRLTLLSLPERAASARLPDVYVQDLTEGYRTGQPVVLTEDLRVRMHQTLARGEQVILFLNRRAYSPSLICRECGYQFGCPNCSVALSFHRRDRRLRCHHCGYNQIPPDECASCHGNKISHLGIGTEKVEEIVAAEFPETRVARLDRDVARGKGALEEILAAFRSEDIGILIGTQIVAKGLDFPKVTLVGVIAADISLNLPDFRSSERTFQLLSQVAGRAGRAQSPGSVVIQTFNPFHPAVVAARAHDYLSIYDTLRTEREEVGYPPFRRLVNIVLSGEDRDAVIRASADVAKRLEKIQGSRHLEENPLKAASADTPGTLILGPADCPIERALNRWRRHLLVKLMPGVPPQNIAVALEGWSHKSVQMVIDVDPYSLM